MIKGIERFREFFSDFSDHYVLIGGSASDLLMNQAGLEFRATKDLDIVLCIESLSAEFVKTFWQFVKIAGYQNQQRSSGKKIFYRFNKPKNDTYPYMLELFSKIANSVKLGKDSHLTPIPMTDELSSLSAILMDEDYYQLIHRYKIEIEKISVLSHECLIPLKAKAWLDLDQRLKAGEKLDSKDVKKHRNDVFRLFQILSPDSIVQLPRSIAKDMKEFLSAILKEPELSLKDFGLTGLKVSDVVNGLTKIYQIK